MDHLICEPPSGDIAILLNMALVDRLQGMMAEAPDREIGGILWGHRESQNGISGRRIIMIDDFEPIESEGRDTAAIGSALSRPRTAEGNVPVGFFRSHQRNGLDLDEADFSMFRKYFSDGAEVFLVARPEPSGVPTAGFFYWEDPAMESRGTCAQFPLDRESLDRDGYSLLRGSSAPAAIPALIPTRPVKVLPVNRRTRRAVYGTIGGVLILGALIWGAFLRFGGQGEDTSIISLSIERRGDSWRLSWDPNAPAVERASSGVLWISDGEKRRGLELNSARLKSGSFLYTPESPVVSFRLDLLKVLAQGSESVRYADQATKPSPEQTNPPETPLAPPLRTPPPATPPRAEPAVSITTQPLPPSKLRTWIARVPLLRRLQRNRDQAGDGFVPPRTLKEVMPHVPARLARDLPGESRVNLKVSVDANGTVKQIDLAGGDERLAKIAADALRQWRFQPARLGDKPVPCDLLATLNFRNPPGGLVARN